MQNVMYSYFPLQEGNLHVSVPSESFSRCSIIITHLSPSNVGRTSKVPHFNEYNPAFHNRTAVPYTERAERVLNQRVAEWLVNGSNSTVPVLSSYVRNFVVWTLTHACNSKVRDSMNPYEGTGYPDCLFSWLFSVLPGTCRSITRTGHD
jgi:hypothetical protein